MHLDRSDGDSPVWCSMTCVQFRANLARWCHLPPSSKLTQTLDTGVYGLGLAPFLTAHQFPYYVEAVKAMSISPVLLVPFKFALAWALCYHTLNGMRHLTWDLGIGFRLKELYASGYTVLAISLVLGAILAFK
ncbi:succinate dehydrogenase, putative [Ixodes scapularis]|uniref:Succinate dehydrogenase, putative n=1 Tax=Ixodes scapularis TaxID=6945 RepID=B7Q0V4_IXOSC|nr:succinate dehydrogenase, putative [Ixodes scapularis]|eukprot:XP_002408353.1 succinate dehydrogenase, putative [Ixodes scapularis]